MSMMTIVFTHIAPILPAVKTEGDTFEEAMKNIREAIELYQEALTATA